MNRRDLIKLGAGVVGASLPAAMALPADPLALPDNEIDIEQWGVYEVSLPGPEDGNPFIEVSFVAEFSLGHRHVTIPGFYDGKGIYKIRFMPDAIGEWAY